MSKRYSEDAYQLVYKHPEWEATAREYEEGFAANLSKSDYVQESARTVLHRLSSMLMAYYGLKDREKEEDIENRDMLGEIAYTIIGDVPSEFRAAWDVEYHMNVLDNINREREILADNLLSDQEGPGQIGDARNYNKSLFPAVEHQIAARGINNLNIWDVMHNDGNLREMMTMLYNGMLVSGGQTKEEIAQSRSLKNMLLNITEEDVERMWDIGGKVREYGYMDLLYTPKGYMYGEDQLMKASVDFDTLKGMSSYKKGTDLFGYAGMVEDLPKIRQKKKEQKNPNGQKKHRNAIKRWFSGKLRGLRAKMSGATPDKKKTWNEIQNSEIAHYNDLGIGLSQREWTHGIAKDTWGKKEAISSRKRKTSAKGMVGIAGPSQITTRMLGAYKLLGASKMELLNFRLALIGWIGAGRDNSLLEILQGSHNAGVVGKEDLTEAATMYQTVDPLNVKDTRASYAPNRLFPHEIIFQKMVNNLRNLRRSRYANLNSKKLSDGSLFSLEDDKTEEDYDATKHAAGDLALRIYTSENYIIMNRAKRNMDEGRKSMLKHRTLTAEEQADPEMRNQVFDVLRVADRVAEDSMNERAVEQSLANPEKNRSDYDLNDPYQKAMWLESGSAEKAYAGITYRGGWLSEDMKSGVYIPPNFTSSSEKLSVAMSFYNLDPNGDDKKGISVYHLKGMNAVNIKALSSFAHEDEVLIPANSEFRVDKFEYVYVSVEGENGANVEVFRKDELSEDLTKEIDEKAKRGRQNYEPSQPKKKQWFKVQMVTYTETGGPGKEAREKANKRKHGKEVSRLKFLKRRNMGLF